MFIVIEGTDQVGKTEQAGRLAEWFRSLGRQVDSYSFPSRGTPTGRVAREWLGGGSSALRAAGSDAQSSRDLAMTFQCVQLVDKYAAVPAIERSLRAGRDVVCCRWWQSAYAYGLDEGLPADWVADTCRLLVKPQADLAVLLDLDPSIARSRSLPPDDHAVRTKELDRYDLDLGKQERVRLNYSVLWGGARFSVSEVGGLWAVVDGSGTPGEVHDRIKTQVPCILESR